MRVEFDAVDLAGVEKLEITNNEFGLKFRMLRQEPKQNFLVFNDGPEPEMADNWLLDLNFACGMFKADQAAIWLAELNLPTQFENVVRDHMYFYRSRSRIETLKPLLLTLDKHQHINDQKKQILLRMLAVCTSAEGALDTVIEALLGGMTGSVIVSATPYAPRAQTWMSAALHAVLAADGPPQDARVPSRSSSDEAAETDPVQRAWNSVLGVDGISGNSNFFELGGSSLLALQLLAQLRRETGQEISLTEFLADPTPDGVRAALETTAQGAPLTLRSADRTGPLPLLPGQRRIWIAEQMTPERSNFAVNAAYHISGPLDAKALEVALAALAEKHEPLRTRIVTVGEEPHQQIDPRPATTALKIVEVAGDDAAIKAEFLAQPFDLASEAPWRARLLRKGAYTHVLLLAVHHVFVDDWSVGLLLSDLAMFYRTACTGALEVAPMVPQFADVCVARSLQPDRAGEIAHWREVLRDSPRTPPLEPDSAVVSQEEYAGGVVPIRISADRLGAVRSAAARYGTTPFVWLLSVFEIALAGLGGQRDLLIGTPLAGRTEPGTDQMVGYFVNPAMLRTTVPETGCFSDFVTHCADVVAQAHLHGAMPFEKVQEALGLAAGPAVPPFHVWFTMLTHAQPRMLDEGLTIRSEILPDRPARFPIALVLEPDEADLIGHLEFARAIYQEQTMTVLAETFDKVLERSLIAPETPVSEALDLCAPLRAGLDAAREGQFIRARGPRLASVQRRQQTRPTTTRTGS
jgi:acyl carrier protein